MPNDSSRGFSFHAGAMSVLERTTHLPSVLLLLAFFIALDIATSCIIGSSVLSLSWAVIQAKITIGHTLTFLIAFGIFMAVGVAIMRGAADQFVLHIVAPVWRKLFPESDPLKAPFSYAVRLWALRKSACVEQNKYYFDRYKEHRDLVDKARHAESRLASHAFACLILIAIDSVVLPGQGLPSLSMEVGALAPDASAVGVSALGLGLIVLWLWPLLRDNSQDEWVYCPSLYRQLEDEKSKAREEGRLPSY